MESNFNPDTDILYRNVLNEIPTVNGILSTTHPYDITRIDHYTNIMNSNVDFISPSIMTPCSSPDELVIQQRGRRKIPVIFSPDIDDIKQSTLELSTELDDSNSNKSSIILRSAPRKRLQLNDPLELNSSEKYNSGPSQPKKMCNEQKFELPESNCLPSALKALSSEQLINIIGKIVIDHPNVEKEVRTNFPIADLKPIEDNIYYLRRNIYKALPTSRLISKTDPMAYNRVLTHILDFKTCIINQGRRLVDSNQWQVVMDYVFMAWRHVRQTPIWDNPPHNAVRRQCFKSLSGFCMTALKHMKDTLEQTKCDFYKTQLKCMFNDGNDEIKLCLQFLNE